MSNVRDRTAIPDAGTGNTRSNRRHFRDRKSMGDPDAAESPFRLQAVKATPPTRAVTLAPGKYAREMALINEAAKQGNLGKFTAWVLQEFFGPLDAHFGLPL